MAGDTAARVVANELGLALLRPSLTSPAPIRLACHGSAFLGVDGRWLDQPAAAGHCKARGPGRPRKPGGPWMMQVAQKRVGCRRRLLAGQTLSHPGSSPRLRPTGVVPQGDHGAVGHKTQPDCLFLPYRVGLYRVGPLSLPSRPLLLPLPLPPWRRRGRRWAAFDRRRTGVSALLCRRRGCKCRHALVVCGQGAFYEASFC